MLKFKVGFYGFVLALLAGSLAQADENFANIRRGNLYTGGEANYSVYYPGGNAPSVSTLTLVAPLEYFVVDHFSLGANITYRHTFASGYGSASNYYGVGPAATYHFWVQNKWTSSFSEIVSVNGFNGISAYFAMDSILALNYFVTPSVAFGPALDFRHAFGNSSLLSSDTFSVLGRFLICL